MENAGRAVIRVVQREVFAKEIKALSNQQSVAASSQLKTLNQILVDGVRRVGGRLENAESVKKHPIILPNHHLTRLIIQDVHARNAHVGSNQDISLLREKHYIMKGFSQIKTVLGKCVEFKKQRAKPVD